MEAELLWTKLKRFDQLELQELAVAGAAYYLKKWGKGRSMEHRDIMHNCIAHGIIMGFRKCEEMRGVQAEENWTEILMEAAKSGQL